jgi:holliday junction DNA helicase RuvA
VESGQWEKIAMINHIRGILEKKGLGYIIIEASGTGYEVLAGISTIEKLPGIGKEAKIFIVESVAMYSGGTTLYGFASEEEREIYLLLKDNITGAGAKKSLDYFDKISKSLPDFKKAITRKDMSLLTGVFGFSKKTAEKIIAGLKDKIGEVQVSGKEKWIARDPKSAKSEAIEGLIALGYKEAFASDAVEKVLDSEQDNLKVEEIIKLALKSLR